MREDFNYSLIDNCLLDMQGLYKRIDISFKDLQNILKEIKTKENWDGDSCSKYIELFTELEKKYNLFLDSFNNDILTLEEVNNNYKELEAKLNNSANE